jgi:hypothetical protein
MKSTGGRDNTSFSNLLLLFFLGTLASGTAADQLEGIVEFTDGTPALATEVNDNNLILSDKSQDLEARVRLLEDTSTRLVRQETAARYSRSSALATSENTSSELVELEGGKLILDNVDCTNDPLALNKAYIENSRFKDITFIIKGDCYGDYWLIDGNNPDAGVRQEFGQSVNITGDIGLDPENPLPRPKLIPNPLTGQMSLVGSFGGGLYLTNVDIMAGSQLDAVLFSRGATGSVRNVSITCDPNYEGLAVGVRVQNGAVPYFEGNIDISGCDWGMWIFNNSTVALYGDLTIDAESIGLWVDQNSSVNSVLYRDSVINISSGLTALLVEDSNVELGWDYPSAKIMDWTGDVIFDAAQGKLNAPLRLDAGSTLLVKNSEVDVYPLVGGGDPNTEADYLTGEALSGITTCKGNSSFNPINRVNSSAIPVSGCFNDEEWTSLYSSTP